MRGRRPDALILTSTCARFDRPIFLQEPRLSGDFSISSRVVFGHEREQGEMVDTSEAIRIIEALANGADPITGELLPESSPYNNPQVIRALFQALQALERLNERGKRQSTLPPKAGKPWTDEEDRLLSEAFDGGASLKDLAPKHGRTEGAIAARLVKLGKVSERAETYDRT